MTDDLDVEGKLQAQKIFDKLKEMGATPKEISMAHSISKSMADVLSRSIIIGCQINFLNDQEAMNAARYAAYILMSNVEQVYKEQNP